MAALAAWTAGGVAAVSARLTYAYVEGIAFVFSKPAAALVAAAELTAFAWTAGIRLPFRVATGTLVAAGTLRGFQRLLLSMSHAGVPAGHDQALDSIWDWEPPASADGGSQFPAPGTSCASWPSPPTGVVKQDNPAIQQLLSQPALAPSELAMRLYYFYLSSDDRPMLDDAQAAAAAGTPADGADDAAAAAAEGVAPVPRGLLEQVARYRGVACLPYDYDTDEGLANQLSSQGFTLLCASHTADISSGCPAFFLEGEQEVMLVIRGTFSPEDAFLDLLATGEAFDQALEGDCHEQVLIASDEAEQAQARQRRRLSGHCHSGMGRAALFLGAKFGPLLRPLYAQGLRVTLVGHSLGAGVASLLAVYLRNRGLGADRLRCWAYETPACMDLELAQGCSDVVTSLVHADDLVPRLCIRSFAGLLEELAAFDWRSAAEQTTADAGSSKLGLSVAQHLVPLLGLGSGGEAGGGLQQAKDEAGEVEEAGDGDGALVSLGSAGFERPYNAHVPGQVVLLFRKSGGDGREGGEGGEGLPSSCAEGQCDGLALVSCTHPAVRRMRLSSRMITDHFVDSPEVVGALGA
ncbi:hypothetical protein CHLNCDRAFT_139223 [Chlorella variabilis]|uniref:sn-1-specific diacylglycerol lipase n=1 Tax=Chlorella variabilis TaxID=554065 RepID=E1ZPT3_CHLVA|nr:hypothetical protein CHLNCDRAFT_139223 [Chlorella variabilis]EFN52035.1 hypothetical protein CHLNCDRAFT_139223 [Chlorella variabilis]|eukprot:XP_005844137.1 hypothetical protein CHLNCDRAFT_139223 [Chlorella variabilis]